MMNISESSDGWVNRVMGSYNYLMDDLRDPRVDNWPLMSSIWPTTFICVAYVYVVKVLGPKFMEKRAPYEIKGILIVYNLFQTLFSFWMFKESWRFFVTGNYSWHCEPVDYSNNPDSRRVLSLGWWYFFSKFIDLLDTMFFIARKKDSQVTTLHVIHHSTLPFLSWWGPRFVGGGQTGFGPFLNSGVHTVMYLYYLLSAFGPKMQKYLWWKKYITTLQLVQFVMVFFHAIQPIFFECDYPRPASIMFAVTGLQYFILFTAFYKKTYKKAPVATIKRNDSAEDLLEDLGETVERVRRNSIKVVERVRRNSITTLVKIRKNSIGVLPPIISNVQLKELEELYINSAPLNSASSGKSEKED
eukprot:GFUD01045035.1.p1 GENE.GFUD01045035.1~~GFUD01045035.1.p1  ORF type:complete len:358 (+),score=65.53 GFUD01045035.1:94-1167(+)